jgi:hypothetical protein
MTSDSPAWEVIGQSPDVGDNGQGIFVKGVEVTYRTRSGAIGKVFVPQSSYTVDEVKRVIDSAAYHSEAVANLKG